MGSDNRQRQATDQTADATRAAIQRAVKKRTGKKTAVAAGAPAPVAASQKPNGFEDTYTPIRVDVDGATGTVQRTTRDGWWVYAPDGAEIGLHHNDYWVIARRAETSEWWAAANKITKGNDNGN